MFAGEIDEAVDMIRRHKPKVIVSEFRMPTMAAKRIVETMNREGLSIPVLVTTSQSGRTADLLVEKLGVAGYLSKPLAAEQVTARIVALLGEKAPVE
jgi:DNA-binding response OmpR family regulator